MQLLGDLTAGNRAALVDDLFYQGVVALLEHRQVRAFFIHRELSFPGLDCRKTEKNPVFCDIRLAFAVIIPLNRKKINWYSAKNNSLNIFHKYEAKKLCNR